MKLRLLLTASALLFATNVSADNMVTAEIPTVVELSNHDINRIVCPGPMSDLIFSQEKGITGHFSGNNAFIKFKIEDVGDEYNYADQDSELFIVCNGAVYTLIVTPKDIPSATIRLASLQQKSFKQNITHYKNMPLEKQALQVIREAYNENYPSSYRVIDSSEAVELCPRIKTTLIQSVDVDGVGLRLKKYLITATGTELSYVDEKLFVSPFISDSLLAVAVNDHTLSPGETSTVFIVEKKEQVR
jgi:conjugal transfer pilus assembly protein TraK